jgi:hypothetical protein
MKIFNISKKVFISSGLILIFMFALANSSPAQSAVTKKAAAKSWNAFWTKFTQVVKTKNRKAFIALTTKDYKDAGGGTIEDWLSATPWSELRASVNKGTKKYSFEDGQVWRITGDEYLLFVFEKGRWRFYGGLVA